MIRIGRYSLSKEALARRYCHSVFCGHERLATYYVFEVKRSGFRCLSAYCRMDAERWVRSKTGIEYVKRTKPYIDRLVRAKVRDEQASLRAAIERAESHHGE